MKKVNYERISPSKLMPYIHFFNMRKIHNLLKQLILVSKTHTEKSNFCEVLHNVVVQIKAEIKLFLKELIVADKSTRNSFINSRNSPLNKSLDRYVYLLENEILNLETMTLILENY